MNREAMLQLRRVAEDAPSDERFDMAEINSDCGTAHCLLGYAMINPWFVEQKTKYELGRETVYRLLDLPDNQYFILFGLCYSEFYTTAKGPAIKAAVIANIDRILNGEEPIPYPAQGFPTGRENA